MFKQCKHWKQCTSSLYYGASSTFHGIFFYLNQPSHNYSLHIPNLSLRGYCLFCWKKSFSMFIRSWEILRGKKLELTIRAVISQSYRKYTTKLGNVLQHISNMAATAIFFSSTVKKIDSNPRLESFTPMEWPIDIK